MSLWSSEGLMQRYHVRETKRWLSTKNCSTSEWYWCLLSNMSAVCLDTVTLPCSETCYPCVIPLGNCNIAVNTCRLFRWRVQRRCRGRVQWIPASSTIEQTVWLGSFQAVLRVSEFWCIPTDAVTANLPANKLLWFTDTWHVQLLSFLE